jgi:tRNA-specific 2-thiouridylase
MKTVYVGLSGGVDSAVAAYLLKKEGYTVVGAFIKGWEPDFLPCTGAEDRLSAMRVAAHLGIPFVTYDLETEYKRDVVEYLVSEYKAGRTPNPDVMCNRVIKFGAFWDRAKADGADMIATGHYALLRQGYGGQAQLGTAVDKDKEQTYFLWTLTQSDLEHTLLPIGEYKKSKVRAIAEEAGLPNFARKDSQGLCFLGHVDMQDFLKRYLPTMRGSIYDTAGRVVGEHEGAFLYTLGQHIATTTGERMFVIAKDIQKNEIIAAPHALSPEGQASYELHSVSWVAGTRPNEEIKAQYRYHGEMVPVRIEGGYAHFDEPVLIASGQSLVVYSADGTRCMGGGIIG